MNYKSQVVIKETHVDPIYGRIFEGWMTGDALNVFGSLSDTHCAMTSGQAIAYCQKVEKHAFESSQAQWFDYNTLVPIQNTFSVETIFQFID